MTCNLHAACLLLAAAAAAAATTASLLKCVQGGHLKTFYAVFTQLPTSLWSLGALLLALTFLKKSV
eukprot:1151618-Pelagomonas_calceolata.AAC.2